MKIKNQQTKFQAKVKKRYMFIDIDETLVYCTKINLGKCATEIQYATSKQKVILLAIYASTSLP